MSIVSKLPGRLRLEIKELINKRCLCRVLELKILEINGAIQAEANHRTGRLLVLFNEAVIDSRELVAKIRETLDEVVECDDRAYETQNAKKSSGIVNSFIHAAIDIAGHMFMPKPLNILLPIAVNAMRKSLRIQE